MKINNKYKLPRNEIDFVNIELSKDNKLFIDPYLLKTWNNEFHQTCYQKIQEFIETLLEIAKANDHKKAKEMIGNLYERNETRLGYSVRKPVGKSLGEEGGMALYQRLAKSEAVTQGLVEDIFDCTILVDNIGEDKVSDLITCIILLDLIYYTQDQCKLWNIPMKKVVLNRKCWNGENKKWEKVTTNLPIHAGIPVVLIPKSFVDEQYIFSYKTFYRDVIIPEYKKRELQKEKSELIIEYKNGRRQVNTKILKKMYPCTKYVVLEFVKNHDILYRNYRNQRLEEE